MMKQEPKVVAKENDLPSEEEDDVVYQAKEEKPSSPPAVHTLGKHLFDEEDRDPDTYQDLVQGFMESHEVQFEVFETTLDGEFKPIFMLGKCLPKP